MSHDSIIKEATHEDFINWLQCHSFDRYRHSISTKKIVPNFLITKPASSKSKSSIPCKAFRQMKSLLLY